jgi:NAD(P)-dependent dehydrogenase (short-subunit alcohol dehydrogenase family)
VHVRAQSHGLLRCDGGIAGAALGVRSRARDQYGLRSTRACILDLADLQSAKSFGAVKTYGRSKLCNILFTRELARRLRDTGVTANCLHPGFVSTRFADHSGGLISHLAWVAKFFAISPEEGAKTIIYLASSPDVAQTTGQYFYKCLPTTPSAAAQDDQSAFLLWHRSAALAGMKE